MSVSVEISNMKVTDDAYLEGTLIIDGAVEIECTYNPFTFSVLYDELQDELASHGVAQVGWHEIEHAAGLVFGNAWEDIQPAYAAAIEKFNETIASSDLSVSKGSFVPDQDDALLRQSKLELVYSARMAQHVATHVPLPKEIWVALDEVWHKTRALLLPQATAEGWEDDFLAAVHEADERWAASGVSLKPALEREAPRPFKVVEGSEHVVPHVVIDTADKAALLFKGGELTPYVAAFGYDESTGTWSQGHYFYDLANAVEYFTENYAPERRVTKAAQKAQSDPALAKSLDGGYVMLSENVVVKPGDPLERVYERQLELSDRVWFGVLNESDENANTVMFAKETDGTLRLMSDNYFANSALVDVAEGVWTGAIASEYVSDELRYSLDCIAEQWGWEKPALASTLQRAQAVSSLHETIRASNTPEIEHPAPFKSQKH